MVWVGIIINGHMFLYVLPTGTMIGQRYINDVLLPHVRMLCGVVDDKFLFMDKSSACHRTVAIPECLEIKDIQCLEQSPDLNPIENG